MDREPVNVLARFTLMLTAGLVLGAALITSFAWEAWTGSPAGRTPGRIETARSLPSLGDVMSEPHKMVLTVFVWVLCLGTSWFLAWMNEDLRRQWGRDKLTDWFTWSCVALLLIGGPVGLAFAWDHSW